MPVTRVERQARALFAAVLHLYPASYRDEYGREMTLVLLDRLRAEHTAVARVVVFVAAIAAVLLDAPKQHTLVLAQDLRLALRLIRRERWFATVAIGTVAIGIALSTAVFSAIFVFYCAAIPRGRARGNGLGDQSAPGFRPGLHLVSAPARLARA
jgi:putative ABC transport system permease protein